MEILSFTFIDILISIVLASIMFVLGLSLTADSFKNIILFPKAFFIGLGSQMIVLPLLAFIIVMFSNLPDVYKVGIIILAVCPGGTTSGFVTFLLKGNVALSISLTAVNSLLTIFSIPLIVNIALHYYMHKDVAVHLPMLTSIIQIFFVTLLPTTLGVILRSLKPIIAEILQKRIKYILIITIIRLICRTGDKTM